MDDEQPEEEIDGGQPEPGAEPQEAEVVDGVVVLASARTIEPHRENPPPLRAVVAVAATGFVAGAATAAVLGRSLARRQARRTGTAATPVRTQHEVIDVVATRRYVVHVRSLARR